MVVNRGVAHIQTKSKNGFGQANLPIGVVGAWSAVVVDVLMTDMGVKTEVIRQGKVQVAIDVVGITRLAEEIRGVVDLRAHIRRELHFVEGVAQPKIDFVIVITTMQLGIVAGIVVVNVAKIIGQTSTEKRTADACRPVRLNRVVALRGVTPKINT